MCCRRVAQVPPSTLFSQFCLFSWEAAPPQVTFQARQYKCKTYSQPGHGKDVLRWNQHHVQPHHLHPVPGKTPRSATVRQPPESPPATSHCLCPTVALTAAPVRRCKARVAPALGDDHGVPAGIGDTAPRRNLPGWPCEGIHAGAVPHLQLGQHRGRALN